MNKVACSVCGDELDEDFAEICLSCGNIICAKELEGNTGFCRACAEKGPYSGC